MIQFINKFILVAIFASFAALSVNAQSDYPTKPITYVVPYPPGGAADVFARQLAKKLSERLDKPVVIVTQEEAMQAEKGFSELKKTWKFKAQNVRDFGFSTSRKFILDYVEVDLCYIEY